jgi:hypothetical protein
VLWIIFIRLRLRVKISLRLLPILGLKRKFSFSLFCENFRENYFRFCENYFRFRENFQTKIYKNNKQFSRKFSQKCSVFRKTIHFLANHLWHFYKKNHLLVRYLKKHFKIPDTKIFAKVVNLSFWYRTSLFLASYILGVLRSRFNFMRRWLRVKILMRLRLRRLYCIVQQNF